MCKRASRERRKKSRICKIVYKVLNGLNIIMPPTSRKCINHPVDWFEWNKWHGAHYCRRSPSPVSNGWIHFQLVMKTATRIQVWPWTRLIMALRQRGAIKWLELEWLCRKKCNNRQRTAISKAAKTESKSQSKAETYVNDSRDERNSIVISLIRLFCMCFLVCVVNFERN